jgi:hypothetical protein
MFTARTKIVKDRVRGSSPTASSPVSTVPVLPAGAAAAAATTPRAPLRARHGRRLADRRPLSVLAAQADQEPTELEDDVAKALFELQEQVSAGLVRSSGALEFVPWWLWWRR